MTAFRSLPCPPALVFKTADHPDEFDAIHRLNHRTFAEEIPQHDPHPDGRLVDRFHEENVYLIARHGTELAGMVALRFDRPFSVEQKAPESIGELPSGHRWCEIRLLAVEPRYRGTALLAGLLKLVVATAQAHHCDAGIISATTRQLKLYGHLGFAPFGHLIGREGAWYQPMWNTIDRLQQAVPILAEAADREPVNLLPGPVAIPDYVREAFRQPAVSHRGDTALRMVREIRAQLTTLTGASHVALLAGGGTLANDVVAGQLRQMNQPGAVLVSGEFGRRLADHASRTGLTFSEMTLPEGTGLTGADVAAWLDSRPETRWLWLTHCETSTGVLHPLTEIAEVCARRGVKLCVDCVSSLGVVPVDLRDVWLASGASGKGLAAYPGVALVFADHTVPADGGGLPRALDLGLYQSDEGMPFTLGSNLIAALHAALTQTDWPAKLARTARHGSRLRELLVQAGFDLSGHPAQTSPAVLTLNLPPAVNAAGFAHAAEASGYLLAAHSHYLLERNQAQICLMGALRERDTRHLPGLLLRLLRAS
jgi:aspartate aminotransferase-like enzyme